MVDSKTPPLVCIVGETASGKSDLALRLAQQLNGEIICADSWTVRREANIGTAKPGPADQAAIRHHLLDVAGPDEDFTAAVFKRLALEAIDDISTRGKLPIMVGGTGLYIDSILYDYGFLEAGDRREREVLNNMSLEELLNKAKAMKLDITTIDQRNKRRVIRLIETNGAQPVKSELRSNSLVLGLKTDREVLKQRITDRADTMITAGLEDEVRGLVERYGWDCEALKGVGYAQWRDYFSGQSDITETRQKIIKANSDLAKRQRTWFRRNKGIHWLDTPVNLDKTVEIVTTFLGR